MLHNKVSLATKSGKPDGGGSTPGNIKSEERNHTKEENKQNDN